MMRETQSLLRKAERVRENLKRDYHEGTWLQQKLRRKMIDDRRLPLPKVESLTKQEKDGCSYPAVIKGI